jgi:hypothetical protein
MTRALCTLCGNIKFGAFCPCFDCGGPADPDKDLSIALSDHRLDVPALERIGEVVRAIAAATPDGDLRRAALLEMFRERFPAPYHRDVAPALVEPARALLATIALPQVNIVRPSADEVWCTALQRSILFGKRKRIWELVVAELATNPALAASAKPARPGSPDLVVDDTATMTVHYPDPELSVVEGGTPSQQHRARHAVRWMQARREKLLEIGTQIAQRQRAFLVGEAAEPAKLTADDLGLGHHVFMRATLRCFDHMRRGHRDHTLESLVAENL